MEIIIVVQAMTIMLLFVTWRLTRARLRKLEYICMTNSKRLRFYHSNTYGDMRIEVIPRKGDKWSGSVDTVYGSFASPTGWEARDEITAKQQTPQEIEATPEEDAEYQPGSWRINE